MLPKEAAYPIPAPRRTSVDLEGDDPGSIIGELDFHFSNHPVIRGDCRAVINVRMLYHVKTSPCVVLFSRCHESRRPDQRLRALLFPRFFLDSTI